MKFSNPGRSRFKSDKFQIQLIYKVESTISEAFCLIGMKSGEIPDSAITASSVHSAAYCQLYNSRLDRFGAWCAVSSKSIYRL